MHAVEMLESNECNVHVRVCTHILNCHFRKRLKPYSDYSYIKLMVIMMRTLRNGVCEQYSHLILTPELVLSFRLVRNHSTRILTLHFAVR